MEELQNIKKQDEKTLLQETIKQKFEDMEFVDGVEFTPEEAEAAGIFKETAIEDDEI